jgi:uncharacterized lipoprotein YmbA
MRPGSTPFLAASLLLALAGCGSDKPTHLYVLSAMAEKPSVASGKGVPIGIGPVTLPKYLDRPQIVTRMQSNSLAQADLDQWGGDLNDNITHVLAANLSSLLRTDRVSLYPWKDRAPIDYQVTLDITRFERDIDGSTVLSAFWSIVNASDGTVLLMRRSTYREAGSPVGSSGSNNPKDARSYDAVAAAMSLDLERLSRDIATAIASLKHSQL